MALDTHPLGLVCSHVSIRSPSFIRWRIAGRVISCGVRLLFPFLPLLYSTPSPPGTWTSSFFPRASLSRIAIRFCTALKHVTTPHAA